MTKAEAVNWIINLSADIGKVEHQELWHYEQALSEIRDLLEDEDVFKVVRCNDCKYWDFSDIHSSICPNIRCKAIIGKTYTDADFYCAYAERREDES